MVLIIALVALARRLVRLHHLLHLGLVHVLFVQEHVKLLRLELKLVLEERVELHGLRGLVMVEVIRELDLLLQGVNFLLASGYAGLLIHYGRH